MDVSGNPRRAILYLGLFSGIAAVSTAAILIRFAQLAGAPSIVIAAARLTIASLVLAPYALIRYSSDLRRLRIRDWLFAFLSGLFLALHFATWITSLEYTSVASSVVLVTTTPLWVALFAPLVLRERIGFIAILGLGVALTGGILVGLSDACMWQTGGLFCRSIKTILNENALWGDFLALLGAWMAAGYMLLGRKVRTKVRLIPYIFIVYGTAAVVLLVIMLGMGQSPLRLPPQAYLWFLLLGLLPQLFGHSVFNWALKYVPASIVAVTLLGEPIGSTVLAIIFFQEWPGWVKIGGAVLILGGIWLASRDEAS
jgi:drug/metabolite transporter (DMT)-like permease